MTMTRFLHFMSVPSPVFNSVLIELVNSAAAEEKGGEHLFMLSKRDTFEQLSARYDNVRYEPDQSLSTIRKYDTGKEVLVLHSLFLNNSEQRHLKWSEARRIVWCVWGHDLYGGRRMEKPSWIWKSLLADLKCSFFRAAVVGFRFDEHEIRRRYGRRLRVYDALYASGYYRADVDRIVAEHNRTERRTNILVGHCAYAYLNHERVLEQLAAYRDEDIVITLVLGYGDDDYADRVVARAHELFGREKVAVYHEFMTWARYIDLLCDVDIAVFDYKHQAAFGNLILLSYLGKKLYLASDGVMYKAFSEQGAEVYDVAEIGRVPFTALTSHSRQGSSDYAARLLDRERVREQWMTLFRTVAKQH